MKLIHIIPALIAILFVSGCASTQGVSAADSDEAEVVVERPKTAYDGSTGSSLLLERYKSGEFKGFRAAESE